MIFGVGVFLIWGRAWLAHWSDQRALRQVQADIQKQDYRSALLMLEQTVQVNPHNLEARRMLAQFYTRTGAPQALAAWADLNAMTPGDVQNAAGWAEAALQFKRYDLAQRALSSVPADRRGAPEYLRVQAGLALAQGDRAELDRTLQRLSAVEPDQAHVQYSAAAVEAFSPDPKESLAAQRKLFDMARGDDLRILATLQLMQLAMRSDQPERNLSVLAAKLAHDAAPGQSPAAVLLAYMESQNNPPPTDAATLANWMVEQGMAREALWWLGTLPAATQEAPAVLRARAEGQAQTQDWTGLQTTLKAGAWGPVNPEVLRQAFVARRLLGKGHPNQALEKWDAVLQLVPAGQSRLTIQALVRLTGLWNWPEAGDRALWRGHELEPRNRAYLQQLAARAERAGDARRLAKVYEAWTEALPGDRYAWASRLYLAAVSGQMDAVLRTKAGQLSNQPGVLPEEALVWALDEQHAGRGAVALQRLADLRLNLDGSPRSALLHAELLERMGRRAEAKTSWLKAIRLQSPLPEETALLEQLRTDLSRLGAAPAVRTTTQAQP